MKKCLKVVVKGRVQGVGFRWFIQQQANQMGLSGKVKNLSNGDVEIEVQGDAALVADFLHAAQKGPAFSKVREIVVEEIPGEEKYNTFEIDG